MNTVYLAFHRILYFPVFLGRVPPDRFAAQVVIHFITPDLLQKKTAGYLVGGIIITDGHISSGIRLHVKSSINYLPGIIRTVIVDIPCLKIAPYKIALRKNKHVAIKQ